MTFELNKLFILIVLKFHQTLGSLHSLSVINSMVLLHFQLSHPDPVLEASRSLSELILEAFWSLWGHFVSLSWHLLGLPKVQRKKHPKFVPKRVCKVCRVRQVWGGWSLPARPAPLREVTKVTTEGPVTRAQTRQACQRHGGGSCKRRILILHKEN